MQNLPLFFSSKPLLLLLLLPKDLREERILQWGFPSSFFCDDILLLLLSFFLAGLTIWGWVTREKTRTGSVH